MIKKLISKDNRQKIPLIFLTFLTLFVYRKTLTYGFYFDDKSSIFNKPLLLSSDLILSLKHNASRPFGNFLWFLFSLTGWNEPEYVHFLAIILHLFCGLTLYYMLINIQKHTKTGSEQIYPLMPILVLAIFLLHPIQTESVVYAIQSISILPMVLCSLLSVTCYLRYCIGGRNAYLIIIYILSLFASLARETGLLLPLLLWLFDLIFLSEGKIKSSFKRWYIFLGTFIISVPVFFCGIVFRNFSESGIAMNSTISPGSYLFTQFAVYSRYLRLVLLPIGQNLDYAFPIYTGIFAIKPFLSLLLLCYLLITAKTNIRKRPLTTFGICLFFLFLAPTSSFIPIEDVIFEHRLYFPLAGVLIAFFSLFQNINLKKKNYNALFTLIVIIICLMSLKTSSRLNIWKNELTLWKDVVKKSPYKSRPYANLGKAFYEKNNLDKAINYYLIGLRLNPNDIKIHNNLGAVFDKQGKFNKAIHHYTKALNIKPDFPDVYGNLGSIYSKLGQFDEAIKHYMHMVKLKPNSYGAYNNIGIVLVKQGELDEAITYYKKAIKINPYDEKINNNIGVVFAKKKKFGKAALYFSRALTVNPDFVDGLYNLGMARSSLGQNKQALNSFYKAYKISIKKFGNNAPLTKKILTQMKKIPTASNSLF